MHECHALNCALKTGKGERCTSKVEDDHIYHPGYYVEDRKRGWFCETCWINQMYQWYIDEQKEEIEKELKEKEDYWRKGGGKVIILGERIIFQIK